MTERNMNERQVMGAARTEARFNTAVDGKTRMIIRCASGQIVTAISNGTREQLDVLRETHAKRLLVVKPQNLYR